MVPGLIRSFPAFQHNIFPEILVITIAIFQLEIIGYCFRKIPELAGSGVFKCIYINYFRNEPWCPVFNCFFKFNGLPGIFIFMMIPCSFLNSCLSQKLYLLSMIYSRSSLIDKLDGRIRSLKSLFNSAVSNSMLVLLLSNKLVSFILYCLLIW